MTVIVADDNHFPSARTSLASEGEKLARMQAEVSEYDALLAESRRVEEERQDAQPSERVEARAKTVATEQMLARHVEDSERQRELVARLEDEARRQEVVEGMADLAERSHDDVAEFERAMRGMNHAIAELAPQALAALQRLRSRRQRFKQLGASVLPGFNYIEVPRSWPDERAQELLDGISQLVREAEAQGADLSRLRSSYGDMERDGLGDLTHPVPLPEYSFVRRCLEHASFHHSGSRPAIAHFRYRRLQSERVLLRRPLHLQVDRAR